MKVALADVRRRALARLGALPHARAAGAFFATPVGRELLQALEAEFVFGELAGASPEETYFNLGAREVVLYVRRLAKASEQGAEHAEAH